MFLKISHKGTTNNSSYQKKTTCYVVRIIFNRLQQIIRLGNNPPLSHHQENELNEKNR